MTFRFSNPVASGSAVSQFIKENDYFYFTIDQTLDWSLTDIVGADLVGKPVDQDINFNVILKDQAKYCFERNTNISI